ncbi:Abi family protein [Mesorhizobium sp. M1340]|uniref:CBS domain-containing protein n=1 Tax=Mesorhizobium sp. M1340 TaxID=2957087 RepID=UPI00333D2F2F
MAESQVPYLYSQATMQAIRASISEPRFATYLSKGGNHEEYALALYLFNARVAKAFLYPINVAEVTLRNAVDEILVSKFQQNWHQDAAFRDHTLTPEGLWTLDKAIQRAGQNASRDQIVATLTFDFWSNLFRSEYGPLWRTTVNLAFPHLQHGESRQDIQNLVRPINTFRNRVAHHEPILDMNITDIYAKIIRLTELRCKETAKWMRHHSTLSAVVRTRPRRDGTAANNLAAKLDKAFLSVTPDTVLNDVIGLVDEKHQAIVCVDKAGRPTGAFTSVDVTRYIATRSKELDGLIALTEHKVSHLIESIDIGARWASMDEAAPVGLAVKELQKPRIQVLVGIDVESGKPTGVILRAHRRY